MDPLTGAGPSCSYNPLDYIRYDPETRRYNEQDIINNCDHCLYLGGQDVETARYMGVKANKPMKGKSTL